MIKAVIFDMNGVIIDDEPVHEMAFKETLQSYGILFDHQTYLQYCAGTTDRSGYQSIAKAFHLNLPIDHLLDNKHRFYRQLFSTHKKPYPGVLDLIHLLAQHFTLALTSSAFREEVDLITKDFGIYDEFSFTISGDDVTKGKPDPEPYLLTVQRLGLEPHECLVIEDAKHGVASAKAAGCWCLAVATTFPADQLGQADRVVESPAAITLEMIRSFN